MCKLCGFKPQSDNIDMSDPKVKVTTAKVWGHSWVFAKLHACNQKICFDISCLGFCVPCLPACNHGNHMVFYTYTDSLVSQLRFWTQITIANLIRLQNVKNSIHIVHHVHILFQYTKYQNLTSAALT